MPEPGRDDGRLSMAQRKRMAHDLVQVIGILGTRTEDMRIGDDGGTGRDVAVRTLCSVVEELRAPTMEGHQGEEAT